MATSLPSWDGWPHFGEEPQVSRRVVVWRTRGTREVAGTFERQRRVAYPARPADALGAISGTQPWPGPAMLWIALDGRPSGIVAER